MMYGRANSDTTFSLKPLRLHVVVQILTPHDRTRPIWENLQFPDAKAINGGGFGLVKKIMTDSN